MKKIIVFLCFSVGITANALYGQVPEIPTPAPSGSVAGADRYVQQGMNFYLHQEFENAIEAFNRALKLDPQNVDGYLGRAMARLGAGSPDEAFADFGKVIEVEPDGRNAYNAYLMRGQILQKKGDLDNAITETLKAATIKPNDPNPYLSSGKLRQAKGDLDGAIADFNKAVSLRPTSAGYHLRGMAEKEKGDLDAALADLNLVIEKNARDSSLFVLRGDILMAKGNLDAAREDYEKATRVGSYGPAYARRGLLKHLGGDEVGAKEDFETASRMDRSLESWIQKALSDAKAKQTAASTPPSPQPQKPAATTTKPPTTKKKGKAPKKP